MGGRRGGSQWPGRFIRTPTWCSSTAFSVSHRWICHDRSIERQRAGWDRAHQARYLVDCAAQSMPIRSPPDVVCPLAWHTHHVRRCAGLLDAQLAAWLFEKAILPLRARGKTVVLVAHSLHPRELADVVIEMLEGRAARVLRKAGASSVAGSSPHMVRTIFSEHKPSARGRG